MTLGHKENICPSLKCLEEHLACNDTNYTERFKDKYLYCFQVLHLRSKNSYYEALKQTSELIDTRLCDTVKRIASFS